ncbi:putative leader peptide [Streptomyces chisholmiae]
MSICWIVVDWRGTACNAAVMSRAGIALVSRRHVDLGRMSSAICSG